MNKDFTWIPHIPLIGGFPIGAEMAFGKPPEFIASLPGFGKNDSHYINYQNVTLGRNLEYKAIEPDDLTFERKINLVVSTPPCAALSQLNCGTTPEAKGAGCAKNEFMYMVANHAIKKYDCDVLMIENAPALFTNKGKDVADNLFKIAKENGYSLTLYKTSTQFHGIPQNRDRCFAIMWKTKSAPIMSYYKRDRKNFTEYLREIVDGDLQHDLIINKQVANEPYYSFLRHKLGKDPRSVMVEAESKTAFNYVNENGYLDECIEWFKQTNNERGLKYALHAKKKFADGKGIWDGSVHVFGECMNAFIGRNANDTIHPEFDRSLTIREGMHMMGLPKNFELLGGLKSMNHICQNVPTCTARDMVLEGIKFLNGELSDSGHDYVCQSNYKEKEDFSRSTVKQVFNSLEEFFTYNEIVDTING